MQFIFRLRSRKSGYKVYKLNRYYSFIDIEGYKQVAMLVY